MSTDQHPHPLQSSPSASFSTDGNRSPFIAPIRSLTVRAPPHFNSTANLRDRSGGNSPPAQKSDDSHQHAALTINQTIKALEGLLKETVLMAGGISPNVDKAPIAQPPDPAPANTRRRPSDAIASRTWRYLESGAGKAPRLAPPIEMRPKRRITFATSEKLSLQCDPQQHKHAPGSLRACGPAHEPREVQKSQLADAELSLEPPSLATTHIPDRRKTKSLEDLASLPPTPVRDPFMPQPQGKIPLRRRSTCCGTLTKEQVREHIRKHAAPPIMPRRASFHATLSGKDKKQGLGLPPALKLNGRDFSSHAHEPSNAKHLEPAPEAVDPRPGHQRHFTQIFGVKSRQVSMDYAHLDRPRTKIDLHGARHVDIWNKPEAFDIHETCHHAPVARDWPTSRKRFTATVACLNTACLGFLIGIYSGEVPAIQYVIADFNHYTILGNVLLYGGLVIPTLLLWPLPLLHGRKPYSVIALACTLCLQIPQGIAVVAYRMPTVRTYRVLLLMSRAVSGFAMGFVYINLQATLMDLFGASLQSHHPHGEVVDEFDVRRHGGGMGLWLGASTGCNIGGISIGFIVGAFIISSTTVDWGFWTSLLLLMIVLLLNVMAPEVRRSAFRRTIADLTGQGGGFSRVARGEIKMHLESSGPFWWGEEVHAGLKMSWLMVKQPGFLVLAVYTAWVYAQFTMILTLLGALTSTEYRFGPRLVGLCAFSLGLGALSAVPFQKASWFSRARSRPPRTDSMTFQHAVFWSSHLVRRIAFTALLPLSAIGYTLSSRGRGLSVALPCMMAALVGFFSNMAIAECYGLVMETFDTSDLQPGMTGKPVSQSAADRYHGQRTNFSCYPRISAGFAVIQSLQFVFAAAATGLCGRLERRVGAMQASGVMAGILLALTIVLTAVLWRWKSVQMIPAPQKLTDHLVRHSTIWEPVILGKPSGLTRKISVLEAGKQTRWSQIRHRNRVETRVAS